MILTACSTGQPGSARVDRSQIARAEIEEVGPSDLYTLVQRCRPLWLQRRGVVVYLDGRRQGEEETLGVIHSDDVETIWYYDSRTASDLYGTDHRNGAIKVTSRRFQVTDGARTRDGLSVRTQF
jgi:hypothetical protein